MEDAFEAKLTAINGQTNGVSVCDGHDVPQAKPTGGEVAPAGLPVTDQPAEGIDKSELVHPELRRIRDKDHLRFVSTQPCLICGRTPADPHHLRFAQSRALGRKVSDEWVVALCRGHHPRFIATVTNAAGGKRSGLTQTLPHEVCGCNLILRVRFRLPAAIFLDVNLGRNHGARNQKIFRDGRSLNFAE